MERLPEFTTVVAIDDEHLREFHQTAYTWAAWSPIVCRRMLLLIDAQLKNRSLLATIIAHLGEYVGAQVTYDVVLPNPEISQRRRMLEALTSLPPKSVESEYTLKLDTDVVAVDDIANFIKPAVFDMSPAIVAPRWGYTKPVEWMAEMEAWGQGFELLKNRGPAWEKRGEIAKHPRVISWFAFLRTDWTKQVLEFLPPEGHLPIPSHDTFLWWMSCAMGEENERVCAPWAKHLTGLPKITEFSQASLTKAAPAWME